MKYITLGYHVTTFHIIMYCGEKWKNDIFLFAAGWRPKEISPGRCAGNKAVFFWPYIGVVIASKIIWNQWWIFRVKYFGQNSLFLPRFLVLNTDICLFHPIPWGPNCKTELNYISRLILQQLSSIFAKVHIFFQKYPRRMPSHPYYCKNCDIPLELFSKKNSSLRF